MRRLVVHLGRQPFNIPNRCVRVAGASYNASRPSMKNCADKDNRWRCTTPSAVARGWDRRLEACSPPGARGESTQSLFSPRGIAQNTLSRRAQHRTTGNTRIHSHFLQPCQCSAFSAAPGSSRSLRWVAMYMAHSNGRNVTGTLGQLMFSEAQLWACSNEAPIA